MGGDVGLNEQRVLLRIKAAGDILRKLLKSPAAQVSGILARGQRVKIGHEVIAVELLGALGPVFDGAEIGAEGEVSGGLDAGEHDFSGFFHITYFFPRQKMPPGIYVYN